MHLPFKLVSAVSTVGRVLYKNAPKIMAVAGAITSVAAVVEAVKATPKAIDILEEHKDMVDKIKEAKESNNPDYSIKDYKRDMFGQYARTIGKLGQTYGRAIALESLSLSLFVGSVKIYDHRNKVLTSTLLATVDAAMSDKQKVYDALGEDEADKIFNGVSEITEEKEVVDKNGKTKVVKETKKTASSTSIDPFCTTLWVEGDPYWDPIEEWRIDHILDVAKNYNRKLFGKKDDNGRYLINPKPNVRVNMNDINKYFKDVDDKDYWTEEHNVSGWDINHPDGEIRARWKNVAVPDPENPKVYLDGMLITWNTGGSICPSLIS